MFILLTAESQRCREKEAEHQIFSPPQRLCGEKRLFHSRSQLALINSFAKNKTRHIHTKNGLPKVALSCEIICASENMSTQTDTLAFGQFLRVLRKRAQLTQRDVGTATGDSEGQINRFEKGSDRPPDASAIVALFIPALYLIDSPQDVAQLLELAAQARGESLAGRRVDGASSGAATSAPTPAHWSELAEGDALQAARDYAAAGDIRAAADMLHERGLRYATAGRGEEFASVADQILLKLDELPSQPEQNDLRCRLLVARADALTNSIRANEAEANLRQAATLAVGAPRAILAYRLAALLTQRGQAAQALAMTRRELDDLPPKHALIRANLKIVEGGALMMLNRYEEAAQANAEAIALAQRVSITAPELAASLLARGHNSLGALNAMRHNQLDALRHWQDAAAAAREAKLKQVEYRCMGNIANMLFEQGDIAGAMTACDAALSGLREIGDTNAAVKFVHLGAILHYTRADLEQALTLANEALALRDALGDATGRINTLTQRARIRLALGQVDGALADAEHAVNEAEARNDQRVLGYALTALAAAQMAAGLGGQALRAAERACALKDMLALDSTLRDDAQNWLAFARADAPQMLAYPPARAQETRIERELMLAAMSAKRGLLDESQAHAQNAQEMARASGYALYLLPLPQFASALS